MTTFWLRTQLAKSNARIDNGDPVLSVEFQNKTERVYCPDTDEYRVTADVVAKAKELGATIITYSSTWCDVTVEGKIYAKKNNMYVMKYSAFFAYLKTKGVIL